MRIFNSEAGVRINGNYGTTPDMASLWVAGTGTFANTYTNNYDGLYFNFSPSIPATYIGFEVWTAFGDNSNRWSQISAILGYGLNAGGTSIAPNNQNYDWYTNNGTGQGNALLTTFDGANRRMKFGLQCFEVAARQLIYVRMVCRYISYVTVSWP